MFPTAPAICSATSGRNTPGGRRPNCLPYSIGESGAHTGSEPAIQTRKLNTCWNGGPKSRPRKGSGGISKAAGNGKIMLKVAIVGCGKIADAHLAAIQRIAGCEVVGACDREPLMAKQLCERFGIKLPCSDLTELLKECRPDVVHITTPPQSHFAIGKLCLDWGC